MNVINKMLYFNGGGGLIFDIILVYLYKQVS